MQTEPRRARTWGPALALAFAVLGLSGLVAAAPARAEDVSLKVSLNAPYDGSNAAFFLAADRGYYAAEGLKVQFDPSGGSGEAVTRIGSGTYDFGFGDINVLMEFNAKNWRTPAKRSTCSITARRSRLAASPRRASPSPGTSKAASSAAR